MVRFGVALATAATLAAGTVIGTAAAADAGVVARGGCGWQAGMATANPPSAIRSGVLKLPQFSPVKLNLTGDVNWAADPYRDPTWTLWFHSLKWMESLATSGDAADLALARAIVTDFLDDNRDPGTNDGAWEDHATSLRTSVLVCMWQRSGGDTEFREWIAPVIAAHAKALSTRYVGPWNHGIMQNLALLGAGCALDVPAWRATAAARLADGARASVDSQGAITEGAPGYAPFIQALLRDIRSHLTACELPAPAGLSAQIAAVDLFAAHATRPGGKFVQLGDTNPVTPGAGMGPYTSWVASGGAQGTQPTDTVRAYDAGYVFGRDSWTNTGQQYTLRFGPGRAVHGHNDHLAVTYWANGHDLLVDPGYSGYADPDYRRWQKSAQAHNVPMVEGAAFNPDAATRLVGKSAAKGAHTWQLQDRAFAGSERYRTVLADDTMRLMLVRDDVTSTRKRALRVLWHLDPSWRKEALDNDARSSRATFRSADGRYRATILQLAAPGTALPANAATLVKGQRAPVQGYVSRGHGDRTPAWVVEARRSAAKKQSVITLIVVTKVGTKVQATWSKPHGQDRIRVTVGKTTRVYDSTRRGGLSVR
ncbi:MAG TPA: heparinase II/III family protein [Sporichthya sp.]|nr:heparinase II/III family protein [Sporichthya sp.]